MAKNASENSMEAQIRANLEATCDKFAGNEDMKPTAEAQTVLEKWLKDFGKDAVKAMKKVA